MKAFLRRILRRCIKHGYKLPLGVRARNQFLVLEREVSINKVLSTLSPNGVVLSGPFKGMRYPWFKSAGSVVAPKILGTYEKELQPIMLRPAFQLYSKVVDIGAAEGYYAVGSALRNTKAQVHAFEANEVACGLLREMCVLNAVEQRVRVSGYCDTKALAETAVAERGLVICDVEGYELELLGGPFIRKSDRFDLLVETHDFVHSGVTAALIARFQASHCIQVIHSTERTCRDFPIQCDSLQPFEKLYSLHEGRPCPMTWLWMQSKNLSQSCGGSRRLN